MDLGLYVHFPFCRKRCPYCDFAIAVVPAGGIPHERYEAAVLAELAARAPLVMPGRTLRSVYFGGGTPSLWDPGCIARVIVRARETFGGEPLEVTVEANPNDCEPDRLAALRRAGANRLSIGGQALDDDGLVRLGRDHGADQVAAAVAAARAAGFERLSLDLIYAIPGRTVAHWDRTLDAVLALEVPHLSVYQLTVEERTPFGRAARRGELVEVHEDESAEAFVRAHERLAAAGYEHYEVSAYGRGGDRAIHNSLYWSGGDYLGLGNGAHSFLRTPAGAARWSSPRSVWRYLDGQPGPALSGCPLVDELTEQSAAEVDEDLVWLGLRTSRGVTREALAGREATVTRYVAAGLLEEAEGRIRPTFRGMLMADSVGVALLGG